MFNGKVRSNGSSIVAELRNAGFPYSLYASDDTSYPGYDSGIYYTCSMSDRGYRDYVTAFSESIKAVDQQKLLGILATNGWTKCRTASAARESIDVYSRNGEILDVTTTTLSGNTTVIVPWALRSTAP